MVMRISRWIVLVGLLALFIPGCAPKSVVTVSPSFKPTPEGDQVYIVPFEGILVPDSVAAAVFNDFVDNLNTARKKAGLNAFFILKQDLKEIDPAWLARQVYIKGEIWGYIQNSSCCQTELKAKGRVHVFEPGKKEPTLNVMIPVESFFEHDRSTLPKEQAALASRLAGQLSEQVINQLSRHK